ncbi:isochorismatase family cysteine hydrolase [Streptomyces sp. NPDC047000]|uniref:cysteine hydrolase family protein n=1 Tax=Streptomyces sp. NPDC047000 TaxID=3155474 RepID=UPI0033F5BCA1
MNTDNGLAPLRHRNRWRFSGGTVDLHRPDLPARTATLGAEPAPVVLDPTRTAVIVVDLQNDFCAPDGWLAGIGVDVSVLAPAVDLSAQVVAAARAAGLPVIWLNWGNRPDQANLPPGVAHVYDPRGTGEGIGSRTAPSRAPVLTKDSWGAALTDGVGSAPGDLHVDKYRMSGFWDTPLDSVLRNLRVDTLVFAGVNSDQCVYATLVDAACLGYDVVLLTDASATTSPSYCHDATVYNVRQCYGFTASTPDLLDALAAARPLDAGHRTAPTTPKDSE